MTAVLNLRSSEMALPEPEVDSPSIVEIKRERFGKQEGIAVAGEIDFRSLHSERSIS